MVAEVEEGQPRRLRLRYAAVCSSCGITLSPGSDAYWDRFRKKALCLACAPNVTLLVADTAGASAAAEGERRKEKRVKDVRRRFGDYAAAVAEEMAERDIAATWQKGSEGESRLAAFVNQEVGELVIPIHDRLIPGTRGNVDHIFVSPSGVWVVDAKSYRGKVAKREVGPIWRRDHEVFVGGRNRTPLAKGVDRQVDAVLAALGGDPVARGTDVYGALCFLESDWALLDFPFQVGRIWVLYPGALRKRLKKKGPLSREAMEHLARRLDLSLPPAGSESRTRRH